MITGVYKFGTDYPAAFDRLFPSITATTSDPAGPIPSGRGGFSGVGDVVAWNVYPPTMADLVAKGFSPDHATLAGTSLGDLTIEQQNADMVAARLAETVRRLDDLIVSDFMVSPSVMGFAPTLANYFGPEIASHPDVVAAMARLKKRYDFYQANYPGTDLLWVGSTMPSGSAARPPIVFQYRDGSFAYAPGFGPVAQYGALQVQSNSVPPQPRVSAYTGAVVGQVSPVDYVPAQVGPNGIPGATGNYPANTATGGAGGTGTGTGTGNTQPKDPKTSIMGFELDSKTMLMAGGGLLLLAVVSGMGRR